MGKNYFWKEFIGLILVAVGLGGLAFNLLFAALVTVGALNTELPLFDFHRQVANASVVSTLLFLLGLLIYRLDIKKAKKVLKSLYLYATGREIEARLLMLEEEEA